MRSVLGYLRIARFCSPGIRIGLIGGSLLSRWQAKGTKIATLWRGAILPATLAAAGFAACHGAYGYQLKVLHSFCAEQNCADGAAPLAGLIMDGAGNLYGTTSGGGCAECSGTVFELVANQTKTTWTETVLYKFCANDSPSCLDGQNPNGLMMDKSGNLYGTTQGGGGCYISKDGCGTVFTLVPQENNPKWVETVLYSFCTEAKCADGATPQSAVVMDGSGSLYGTTANGGAVPSHCPDLLRCGTVFKLVPDAAKTTWTETVLHTFCPERLCPDGSTPGGLFLDSSGNLYGTTEGGGGRGYCLGGTCGVAFELTPNPDETKWAEKVLYSFCPERGCADGWAPASLIMSKSGNLFGTAQVGGVNCERRNTYGCGTVFELAPNAARTKWTETVLYNFCAQTDCIDGAFPNGLILGASGDLYGTTNEGGAAPGSISYPYCVHKNGCGTIFKLVPNAAETHWTEKVLYSFCAETKCADGAFPNGLIMDKSGNIYGTTGSGGSGKPDVASGTVFELVNE